MSPGIRHEDIEAMVEDVDRSLEVRALASEFVDEIRACHCLIRVLVDVGFSRPGDVTALRHGLPAELVAVLDQILGELPEAS